MNDGLNICNCGKEFYNYDGEAMCDDCETAISNENKALTKLVEDAYCEIPETTFAASESFKQLEKFIKGEDK